MELKVKWTDFSKNELKNIFEYYKDKASVAIARKLVTGIVNETLRLKLRPTIGQEEELLKNSDKEFRYIVFKNYKIIYFVNSQLNTIEVVDVFDTRQNPNKNIFVRQKCQQSASDTEDNSPIGKGGQPFYICPYIICMRVSENPDGSAVCDNDPAGQHKPVNHQPCCQSQQCNILHGATRQQQ